MKLTFCLLTVAMLHVSARGVSQNIHFSGTNVPLEKVLSEVKRQSGYVFFYDVDILRGFPPVTMEAKDMPLPDFLNALFKNSSLQYMIHGNSIVIHTAQQPSPPAARQPSPPPAGAGGDRVTVTGHVTDPKGNPLAGATVMVKMPEGAVSMATDAGGNFSITVEVGQTVEISYVGYKDRKSVV